MATRGSTPNCFAVCADATCVWRQPRVDGVRGRPKFDFHTESDGDLRQLVGRRRYINRAVAKHLDAVIQQHEEHGRHNIKARRRLQQLQRRPHRRRRTMTSTGNHAVGHSQFHHHRSKSIGVISHELLRLLQINTFVLAQLVEALCQLIEELRITVLGVDDFHVSLCFVRYDNAGLFRNSQYFFSVAQDDQLHEVPF